MSEPEPDAVSATGSAAVPGSASRASGVRQFVAIALSVALLGFVVLAALALIVVPKIAGATPLTVLTSSMKPGLPPGTLIIVQPVKADDVRVGDVITYQIRSGDPAVITHRVVAINSDSDGELSFILQGDNNSEVDEPVKPVQIQARLWYSIPYVGFVNSAVNGENRSWIVPVVAGLLFAYAAYMIVSGLVAQGRKRAGERRTSGSSGDKL